MITNVLLIALLLICSTTSFSYAYAKGNFVNVTVVDGITTISGNITMQNSTYIPPNVVISLHNPADSSMVSYAVGGNRGDYKITYNGDLPSLLISVSAINIKREFKEIVNKTQVFDFLAQERIMKLKEVFVKIRKIIEEKDTINYNVASFKTKKDITIGEVLKRMPGIEVAKSGQISYNGRNIDNFYIEGMDLLGGRYGIATNNVGADDVKTVQVLNKHEPIKALKGLKKFNEKVGLNLKLKEDAKGTFLMTTILGGGYDGSALYNGELTGMYFGRKRQNIFTLKGNNSGAQLASELTSFSGSASGGSRYTSIQMPSPPGISLERYLFNDSYSATANHMNKLKNDANIRANIIYYNNRETRASFARSEYLMPDSSKTVITEKLSSEYKTHTLNGDVNYNLNKDKTYVENDLKTSVSWNDGMGTIISDETIDQNLDDFLISVSNRTNMIFRSHKGGGVRIGTTNSFNTLPHELVISPGVYPDIFNDSLSFPTLKQYARSNNLSSNSYFSLLSNLKAGKIQFTPTASLNVLHQTLESYLTTINTDNDATKFPDTKFQNNMRFTRLDAGVSLYIRYNAEDFQIGLRLPLNLHNTIITNVLKSSNNHRTKFYFQPNLSFKYEISSNLILSSGYGLSNQTQSLNNLYEGYILRSYRSLGSYDSKMYDRISHGANIKLEFKSVMDMFFANINASASQYRSDVIFKQSFDGILSVTEMVELSNEGEGISVRGMVSKGFIWKSLLLNITGSWSESEREQLRESSLVTYNSNNFGVNTRIGIAPVKWLSLNYDNNWSRSKSSNSLGYKFDPMDIMTNTVNADIYLPFDIGMTGKFEHYYNSTLQSNKNLSFADLGLFYTYKKTRFSLDWTNILNTSKYTTSSYGGLDTFYSEYNIRPSMVMLKVRFKIM